MADGGVKRAMATSSEINRFEDRLSKLYPLVDEGKTPLPRSWASNNKVNHVGLSHNNLRVQYKGHGKTHRDAASVQACHSIPSTCGLYYFEVKIFSKGRDGYMGVGLSASNVNLNRLPGWDKLSYGYHGDDGHSFCSSGTGLPYGPTFTTGDVIGCGVNLVDNTCFYTKNGHNLGIAFRELPPDLYPTVGLQTPGEIIDANFGQEPFVFDIEDVMNEMRTKTRMEIADFAVPHISQVEWQAAITEIVSTYLIHNGYYNTAEALAHITNQPFNEDTASIKNRQKILKLVLAGRMGEAIGKTSRLYPGLLENDENLLFMLKCRQFVEMVNGSDIEVAATKKIDGLSPNINASPRSNSPIQTSVIQSTKNYSNKPKPTIDEINNQNNAVNGDSVVDDDIIVIKTPLDCDVDMDTLEEVQNGNNNENECNGKLLSSNNSNGYQNGNSHETTLCLGNSLDDDDEEMEVDLGARKATKPAVERILEFGRELYSMNERLKLVQGTSAHNEKMLEDAFSLLAYSNPWSSPVGWQLDQGQRERVCASLNSAILELQNKPRKPSLEMILAHAQELMCIMCSNGFGSCAFTSVSDLMEH